MSDERELDDRERVDFYREVVEATFKHPQEFDVKMTLGELFLFHVLLQEFGLLVLSESRFIPLMERSKARLSEEVDKQWAKQKE